MKIHGKPPKPLRDRFPKQKISAETTTLQQVGSHDPTVFDIHPDSKLESQSGPPKHGGPQTDIGSQSEDKQTSETISHEEIIHETMVHKVQKSTNVIEPHGATMAEGEIFCLEAMFPEPVVEDPIVFKAISTPNMLYYHQAIQQPDQDKFLESREQEVNSQMKNKTSL